MFLAHTKCETLQKSNGDTQQTDRGTTRLHITDTPQAVPCPSSQANKCRRRGNKTGGKPKGDKTKGVKPPQYQGRASRSSHHHFRRKFACSSILKSSFARAPPTTSCQQSQTPFSFQCSSSSKCSRRLSVHCVIQKCCRSVHFVIEKYN